jgi:uncharacterized protein
MEVRDAEARGSEVRDGMRIDWDVPIRMDDGVVLRADVFRPIAAGRYPAILTYGPYGKGLSFAEGYKTAWDIMINDKPEVLRGTSGKYMNWEVVDPEKWVPDGYACVRVDSRGAGRSPGVVDHHSTRERQDFHDCIEWVGTRDWCNGKVGLNGISYYASTQWRVAALQPSHLAAMCIWEGFAENYREAVRHGGITCTFRKNWQEMQIKTVQHGRGTRGPKSALTGELVCGPETLPETELEKNRAGMWDKVLAHPLDDAYWAERAPDWSKVKTPLLSCGNWGGQGLHLRGNVEGFLRASTPNKWLELHGGTHWTEFYTDYGVSLQKRFFDHFLKGEHNGWERQPRVQLQVRHIDKFVTRYENEWPLARTKWTKFFLHSEDMSLSREPSVSSGALRYDAMGDGLTFKTAPLEAPLELTGPSALNLRLSSETTDADVFAVVRVFDPEGAEVVFQGALDPHTPVGQGWLRASHRKLDPKLSTPYRPYHTHDELQPLTPGQPVDLAIEIWPTCIVIPKGYRLAVTVRGKDYEYDGELTLLSNLKNPMRGCGPFLHDDPMDRPTEIFGKSNTIHFGGGDTGYVVLPVIPSQ